MKTKPPVQAAPRRWVGARDRRRPESLESIEIGIPDPDGFDEHACLPGWEIPISEFFGQPGDSAMYAYDFGDGWEHAVVLEAIVEGVPSQRYPLCLAGERACPPEDCGGVPGYEELLQILQDPSHDEYEERVHWLGRVYDPEEFNHREVKFDDPRKRWNAAFAET